MKNIITAVSGLLFGIGLSISGMMSPNKVIGFLDIFGNWDPSLALVMGGGLFVTTVSFFFVLKRDRPKLDTSFDLPIKSELDGNLIFGSALFGIGWGLIGLCPGPAIANISTSLSVVVFVITMLISSVITKRFL